MGLGGERDRYPRDVLDAYRRLFDDGASIEAMCEDYRAGATVDAAYDDADREAGRTIACPVQVLWGARGGLPRFYDDVLEVWRPWAPDRRGAPIDASHFLVEDRPEETARELLAFLAG
jgi:haloacetate dehalogenase